MPSDHGAAAENGVAARAALRTWILGKNKELDPDRLTDSTPLFTERYLRSIHLPELILLVERLRGGAVDVSDLTAGHFRDIDTIVNLFVTPINDSEHT